MTTKIKSISSLKKIRKNIKRISDEREEISLLHKRRFDRKKKNVDKDNGKTLENENMKKISDKMDIYR